MILDNIYITFHKSREELKKIGLLEKAIELFAEGNSEKLGELIHKTKGNQLVQIMIKGKSLHESTKYAVKRVICEYIERLFSDMRAQARTDPEVYGRLKERLDIAQKQVPTEAEKLADLMVNRPLGRWPGKRITKTKLSDSLLR